MILLWPIILVVFGFYTFGIFSEVGFLGFFPPIHEKATLQIFLDLSITGFIALFLMYDRRKKHQKSIMPVIITGVGFCFLGSPALLLYLIWDWFTQIEKPSQRGLSAR